jgi:hypothetical protein
MVIALSIFVVLIVVAGISLHRRPDNDFNVLDLLMENGHVSKAAVVMMGAFSLTSWMMVELTLIGKMTEGYFGLYAAAWIAPVVVKLVTQGPTTHNPREEKLPQNGASAPVIPAIPKVPDLPNIPGVKV